MNTEKLYTIAKELNDDFASTKISENLNEVIANLQNLINSPNNPTYQTGLRTGLDSFYSSLSSSKVNSFSPAQKDVLSQIEGGVFLGNNLIEVVTDLIERNQLTPSVALEQLTKYQEAINRLRDGVNKIVSGFNDLKLEKEILDNNTCEVGVLIPRTQIDNSLSIFSKEVNELIFIFNHFSEFAEGEKKDYKIRSLSSSDLFVSIVSQPVVWVLAFAKSVEWLLDKYKTLLEIKKLKIELKDKGLPEKALQGIEDHANDYISNAIEDLLKMIEKEYCKITDTPRKNEVKNGLRISLNKIVNRIDKGYNYEVRVIAEVVEQSQQDNDDTSGQSLVTQIKAASTNIEFNKISGEQILSLPESSEKSKKV